MNAHHSKPHALNRLRQELALTEERLQRVTEELASSNAHERSVNEEMKTANEELATSREDLLSLNDELSTINHELETRTIELSRVNDDVNSLLAGTGIATVFLDHQLCVVRFTPAATAITNLIHGDVGRPIGHIVSNLGGYDSLVPDLLEVLHTLVSKEVEVQTTSRRWFTMHIQPYRTIDEVIEGAVISFIDITKIVHARDAQRQPNEAQVYETATRGSERRHPARPAP